MKILKLEPYSGISGDMFLGALAPLLEAEADIVALPARLGLQDVEVGFADVQRCSIRCRKANVAIHGHGHAHDHPDHHDHAPHEHGHDHPHGHHEHGHHEDGHQKHGHGHRSYCDIVEMIGRADLPSGAKELACRMFTDLGEAESAMHGIPLSGIHFHEVGAEDSIIDLVGAAMLMDLLRPDAVYASPVCVGSGFVRGSHGRLPVPAPATHHLLQGMPTFAGPIAKEMTTPTGAAILKAIGVRFDEPVLVVERSSLGAGSRDLDQPNALRASLCRAAPGEGEKVVVLQSNLDNVSGEEIGADCLADFLAAGAWDAWLSPILMKKGRPAQMLEVLCPPAQVEALTQKILRELPTLGVRRFDGGRTILPREIRSLETPYGPIAVKVHHPGHGFERLQPEYASCREAALRHGVPLHEVYRMVWSLTSR